MRLGEIYKKDEADLLLIKHESHFAESFTISDIQQRLRIGYNRAAHLVDRMVLSGTLERPSDAVNIVRFMGTKE